jgi:hypothetical protein
MIEIGILALNVREDVVPDNMLVVPDIRSAEHKPNISH